MRTIINKVTYNKRIKPVVSFICVVAIIGALLYRFNFGGEIAYGAEPIKPSVMVGDNTYTNDEKLDILEIVPDKALAELGYLVGGDSNPIKWQDIMEISNNNTKANIAKEWMRIVNTIIGSDKKLQVGISGKWYTYGDGGFWSLQGDQFDSEATLRIVDSSNQPMEYQDANGRDVYNLNVFAYITFSGYDMCDKIQVTTKIASQVTEADIEKADLIYISAGSHDSSMKNLYVNMAKESNSYSVSDRIDQAGQSRDNFDILNQDLGATEAWAIYMAMANQETAVIMDSNVTNTYNGSNIDILYTLIYGADREVFKEQFWKTKSNNTTYTGTLGKVVIENKGTYSERLKISYKRSGNRYTDVSWSMGCLAWITQINDGTTQKYYYNEGTMKPNVWNNTFCYNGDMVMSMGMYNGTIYANTSWDGKGSTIGEAYDIYGSGNTIKITDVILYILGDYKFEKFDGTINVLEIEPAGAYKYNKLTAKTAGELLGYFGYRVEGISDENCTDYVKVTSVASNGFIAMTEDIINNYDLIIISDYNQYSATQLLINTGITKIYAKEGPSVNLYDYYGERTYTTALSGNDFTYKAYEKVLNYIRAGKAIVLADSIYEGDTSVVDADTNISKLSYANLLKKLGSEKSLENVIKESKAGRKKLTYYKMPEFTVSEEFYYSAYEGTDIAKPNIQVSDLKAINFSGNIKNYTEGGSYSLKVYVDKDANGFYTETENDSNELLFETLNLDVDSNGNFSVVLQEMSSSLRGYLQWKAVLFDNSTDMSSDEEGAFVVTYADSEIKTVKVLQISPGGKETLRLDSSIFGDVFAQASHTTGLELDVTVLTAEQFEALYTGAGFEMKEDAYGNKYAENDLLTKRGNSGYDMVVLGFSDAYSNNDISDVNGALSNIQYYIESGNSVLMAHDVLSFNSYSDKNVINQHVNFASSTARYAWSYELTARLRGLIGMDRYNASSGGITSVKNNQGYSNVFLQQFGTVGNGKRILYYPQKAIYDNILTTTAKQLNRGQITQYPYRINENLMVANTHTQYFQLDLESQGDTEEDDIVVWYTLSGASNTYYGMSGQDALNNYYIYSKGNITYSGAGHINIDKGTEIKLFVNTIIRAIGAGNNLPYVEYNEPAVSMGQGLYEQYIRSGNMEEIHFTPYDSDMTNHGIFKAGYIFWDKNESGLYDQGDILLKEYTSDTGEYLINNSEYTFDLMEYIGDGSPLSNQDRAEITSMLNENQFKLTIQLIDSNDGKGASSLNIVKKEYFQLD